MATDLENAQRIVAKRERWIGSDGQLQKNVADAVAEGIAFGRREGLESATKAIRDELAKLDLPASN